MHGSVFFKLLDDAAFYAACSLEKEFFMVTSAFTTYFLRPVERGTLRATGKVLSRSTSQVVAEAVIYDVESKEIARGSGIFVRSRSRLEEVTGYIE